MLCGWYAPGDGVGRESHDPACPEIQPAGLKVSSRVDNQRGFRDGRSGRDADSLGSAFYRLGYNRGVVALEEAENGHDIRFD